jgi:hypothetical protein
MTLKTVRAETGTESLHADLRKHHKRARPRDLPLREPRLAI